MLETECSDLPKGSWALPITPLNSKVGIPHPAGVLDRGSGISGMIDAASSFLHQCVNLVNLWFRCRKTLAIHPKQPCKTILRQTASISCIACTCPEQHAKSHRRNDNSIDLCHLMKWHATFMNTNAFGPQTFPSWICQLAGCAERERSRKC